MKTNNPDRKQARARISILHAALVLACVALPATIVNADHKAGKDNGKDNGKGNGKDKGGGPGVLARAHFHGYMDEGGTVGSSIASDFLDYAPYTTNPLPFNCAQDSFWHYWDSDDLFCGSDDGVWQSDTSKGGRWIFSTSWQAVLPSSDPPSVPRYVKFYWPEGSGLDLDNPNPDSSIWADILRYPGYFSDPTPDVDNLLIYLNADQLFKSDGQIVDIRIWTWGGGRDVKLEYTSPLHIIPSEDGDTNKVILSTLDSEGINNVSEARLVTGRGKKRTETDLFSMPLKIRVQRD